MAQVFDVVIIGGGVNGCGCAADAALRGLSVLLIEEDDLASKTSSKSTKLIHGGLRYLEQYNFHLVKAALDERQKLLQLAPHLVHPQSFVLPYQKNMRPLWILRAGLFIYDYLSRANKLPHSKLVHRRKPSDYFTSLNPTLNKGFLFYDCSTDDARLTLANALQAKANGAMILPQTKLIYAEVIDKEWRLTLQPKTATSFQVVAKSIINAAGPWVANVNQLLQIPLEHNISLVKGSHLVVQKLYEGEHAYMLQHLDKRIIFAIPYHGHTMIGTTDVAFTGNIDDVSIETSEIAYLCTLVSHYFNRQLQEKDIINTWSGIRPLLSASGKTPTDLSRDYAYHYSNLRAPAVTVYGGKITTYRQLALKTIDQLRPVFPNLKDSLSHTTPLPGATYGKMSFSEYQRYAREKYHWLDEETLTRYLGSHGTLTEKFLAGCKNKADLGACFTETLYEVEVNYLVDEEWATCSDDILWRRTKLGLTIDDAGKKALRDYLLIKVPKIIPHH